MLTFMLPITVLIIRPCMAKSVIWTGTKFSLLMLMRFYNRETSKQSSNVVFPSLKESRGTWSVVKQLRTDSQSCESLSQAAALKTKTV